MTSVDRVKTICKERKIPISRLEKDLGFSNGYIGQLRKGVLPDDRLRAIADYLDVTTQYLMVGDDSEKPAPVLTARDERDINKSLDHIMSEILNGDDGPLYYNGQEIDQASLSLLRNAFEFALRETKKENKEIYNPHKNKG